MGRKKTQNPSSSNLRRWTITKLNIPKNKEFHLDLDTVKSDKLVGQFMLNQSNCGDFF